MELNNENKIIIQPTTQTEFIYNQPIYPPLTLDLLRPANSIEIEHWSFSDLSEKTCPKIDIQSILDKPQYISEMKNLIKELSEGCVNASKKNLTIEFIGMKFYELLQDLSISYSTHSSKIKTINVPKKLKDQAKTTIKNEIIAIKIRLLRMIGFSYQMNKLKTAKKKYNYEEFTTVYTEFYLLSKTLLDSVNGCSKRCNNIIKKYANTLRLVNNLIGDRDTPQRQMLHEPLNLNTDLSQEPILLSFEMFEKVKNFHSKSKENCILWLDICVGELEKIYKSFDKKKYQIFENKLKLFKNNCEKLFSQSTQIQKLEKIFDHKDCKTLINFLHECRKGCFSGTFKIDQVEEMKKISKSLSSKVLELEKIDNAEEHLKLINELKELNKSFKELSPIKNSSQNSVNFLSKHLPQFENDFYACANTYFSCTGFVESIFNASEALLEKITQVNEFHTKLFTDNQEMFFNKAYTFVSPLIKKVDELLLHNPTEEITTSLISLKRVLEGYVSLSSFLYNDKKNDCDKKKSFLSILKPMMNETKQLRALYEGEEKQFFTQCFFKINMIVNFLNTCDEAAIFYLINQNEVISNNEFMEFKEVVFPRTSEKILKHEYVNFNNAINKVYLAGMKNEKDEEDKAFYMCFVKPSLDYVKLYYSSINNLINLLTPKLGESWKLTEENIQKIKNEIFSLSLLSQKDVSFSTSLIHELDEYKINIALFIINFLGGKKIANDRSDFHNISFPYIKKWFKEEIKKFNENKRKMANKKKEKITNEKRPSSLFSLVQEPIPLKIVKETILIEEFHLFKIEKQPKEALEIEIENDCAEEVQYKTIYRKKKPKTQKTKTFWLTTVERIDHIYEKFHICSLDNIIESYWNSLSRLKEIDKGQSHIIFHIKLIESVFPNQRKIPQIYKRIVSQGEAMIVETILKSGLAASKTVKDEQHILLCDNKKLLSTHHAEELAIINKTNFTRSYLIKEVAPILNHSYVSKIPEISKEILANDEKNTTEFFEKCLNHLDSMKKMSTNVIDANQIEKMRKSFSHPMNLKSVDLIPEEDAFDFSNVSLEKSWEHLLQWIETNQDKNQNVTNAKERVSYAKSLWDELEKNSWIRKKSPTLYCTILTDINNMVMSNTLHLLLDQHSLLEEKIGERPAKHCHNPSKLWDLLKDKIKFDDIENFEEFLALFSADSRYPYAKRNIIEERLTEVYEIETSNQLRHVKNTTQRLQKIINKHQELEYNKEALERLISSAENNLYKCLECIGRLIKEND